MNCPKCTAAVKVPTTNKQDGVVLIARLTDQLACPVCDFWAHKLFWANLKEQPEEPFKPVTHWLKIEPRYFYAHLSGAKSFEVRKNDRGFRLGQMIVLQMWSLEYGYHGKNITTEITYITDYPYGLKPGYVVLGLKKTPKV